MPGNIATISSSLFRDHRVHASRAVGGAVDADVAPCSDYPPQVAVALHNGRHAGCFRAPDREVLGRVEDAIAGSLRAAGEVPGHDMRDAFPVIRMALPERRVVAARQR